MDSAAAPVLQGLIPRPRQTSAPARGGHANRFVITNFPLSKTEAKNHPDFRITFGFMVDLGALPPHSLGKQPGMTTKEVWKWQVTT